MRPSGPIECRIAGVASQADAAGHREDDVRTLADVGVRQRLARAGVGEVADEVTLLGLLIPAEDLDAGVMLRVVVLDPVPEAVLVDGDRAANF